MGSSGPPQDVYKAHPDLQAASIWQLCASRAPDCFGCLGCPQAATVVASVQCAHAVVVRLHVRCQATPAALCKQLHLHSIQALGMLVQGFLPLPHLVAVFLNR